MHVITLNGFPRNEIYILKSLIAWPHVYVHIRKPTVSEKDYERILSVFSLEERLRLIAHQFSTLSRENGVPHLHLSTAGRNQVAINEQRLYTSTSTHSWGEFNALGPGFKMAFVSPVFPSISKKGYGVDHCLPLLGRTNRFTSAIALGGINADRLQRMDSHTFNDFALCGGLWEASDPIREARDCYESQTEWINKKVTF
ncbi:beta/alpha barrel domain-containing protein [Sphingobacterium griseoflavum]|uniref:Thiamine phosphate synthase n=1 Tax=Sphingobacterium griseoflavum TaxID=1474952 RepID=A0ABQ3HXB2_9SPHI|nr:hypothetical protein [Sphingobacterium griseoflavum]GHE33607.1 thiamine phosphate synthase [Sphingobacterium griseoflavum]